jgi:hypothetical protein
MKCSPEWVFYFSNTLPPEEDKITCLPIALKNVDHVFYVKTMASARGIIRIRAHVRWS